MKKLHIFLLVLLAAAGCYKDQGNYNYHAVNQLLINNFDTVKGYIVLYNDTLTVSPSVTGTLDANAPASNYAYQWSVRVFNGVEDSVDSVIAVTPVLKVLERMTPGNYTLTLRVTDNSTKITFQALAPLLVSSTVYEGFLVLNNVSGGSRLDMLSYNASGGTFAQYTDVLKMEGSALTLQGAPYQVFCGQYTNPNISAQDYGIYLLTSGGANRVNQETFGWDETYNVAATTVGDVPANWAPGHMWMALSYSAFPDLFFWADSNVYAQTLLGQYALPYIPLNAYNSGANPPFAAAPFVCSNGSNAALFDLQQHSFALTSSFSSTNVITPPAADNLPTGKDLVFMEYNYSGNCNAILKDTTASPTYYMLRWPLGGGVSYYQPIPASNNIASATHFAFSPNLGYLFYSVGGQVYEYDLSLQTSKLMLDMGSNVISYLHFNNFYNMGTNTTYAAWANDLLVGSCDASGANGTLGLYSVPTVNGQIQQLNQWTGFGKIVSVSYRER